MVLFTPLMNKSMKTSGVVVEVGVAVAVVVIVGVDVMVVVGVMVDVGVIVGDAVEVPAGVSGDDGVSFVQETKNIAKNDTKAKKTKNFFI